MNYTPEQIKAAFLNLLNDYHLDLLTFGIDYCSFSCPFNTSRRTDFGTCSLGFLDDDDADPDSNDCAEQIFKWYVENSND